MNSLDLSLLFKAGNRIEAIAILVVLIGGCLFVLRAGIGGWAVPALGYVASNAF